MKDIHDSSSHYLLSNGLWLESEEVRKDVLIGVCKEIVMMFVELGAFSVGNDTNDDDSNNNDKEGNGKEDSLCVNRKSDKVQLYASKGLTMGFISCDNCDAIKEGDGLCILRTLRYP
uniref:Uncharacterized protein n=1 Tax=Amphimedon queenslandica TaxID=400682 RepID=A0A1X7UQ64_AMPQE